MTAIPVVSARKRCVALLPLGRRWSEGPDEGAFTGHTSKVTPHQFGRMTYSCIGEHQVDARVEPAAVSHGLMSSPPRERSRQECV